MKTFLYIFCLLPLVPSTVLAWAPNLGRRKNHDCLTDSRATTIAETWCQLNIVFDEVVANATLAEDFELFSDSENWISSPPPNAPVLHLLLSSVLKK
jgi:hypothetical protein